MDKELAASEAKKLIALERRQEDDAFLLSREYDDDYDDQVDLILTLSSLIQYK